jgi:hypothetical protein
MHLLLQMLFGSVGYQPVFLEQVAQGQYLQRDQRQLIGTPNAVSQVTRRFTGLA